MEVSQSLLGKRDVVVDLLKEGAPAVDTFDNVNLANSFFEKSRFGVGNNTFENVLTSS